MIDEEREVRLALVMTGGVSLAVWMGGVSGEIYRMTRRDGLYDDILTFAGARLSVDVISGSSAGGLNGALLGTAIARELPCSEFDNLRRLWFEAGSFAKLLRSPARKDPPSLMQGDEFFMVQIRQILERWARGGRSVDLGNDGLEVILTGSLLSPDWQRRSDVFGTVITEPVHRALFRFTPAQFRDTATLPARLALAARTSASFPGAFEPSFVPIGAADARPGRPDMAEVASFATSRWVLDGGVLMNKPVEPALAAIERRSGSGDVRRVLAYVNPDPGSPDIALDFADDAPTIGKVVLSSLVAMPRAESIADDLATIAQYNQSFSGQQRGRDRLLWGDWIGGGGTVDGVDAPLYEARAAPALVRARLRSAAAEIYPLWVRRRHTDAVRTRLERHLSASKEQYEITTARRLAGGGFTYAELRAAMEEQRRRMGWLPTTLPAPDTWVAGGSWRLGFTPLEYLGVLALDLVRRLYAMLPVASSTTAATEPSGGDGRPDVRATLAGIRRAVHRERAWLRALREADDDYYQFSLDHLEELAPPCATDLAAAIYEQWPSPPHDLVRIAASGPVAPRDAERLASWQRVQLLLAGYDDDLASSDRSPDDPRHLDGVVLTADLGADGRLDETMRRAELRIARRLAGYLLELGPVLGHVLADYRERFVAPTRSAVAPECVAPAELWEPDALEQTALVLGLPIGTAVPGDDAEATVLADVTALYLVHASTQPDVSERSTAIQFAQLSAAVGSELDPARELPADKVAGLQAAHFGAFLKESWRANDWMWGGLDAASRLVSLILEPPRMQQMYASCDEGLAALRRVFCGGDNRDALFTSDEVEELGRVWTARYEPGARIELAFLDRRSGLPLPMSLPTTARALAYVLQLSIAQRELPEVAAAIERSAAAGADESVEAAQFVRMMNVLRQGQRSARVPLMSVEALVRACRVGFERVVDELGSDAGAATVTKVAAVAATAGAGTRSGLGPLRHGVKVVRTGLIAAHVTATTAARRSNISFALITLLLAVGAGAIAARLIGGRVPTTVLVVACFALGFWMLLTGFTARAWRYSFGGLLALGAIGLSFVEPATLCPALATTCPAGTAQPGWKGTLYWLVPLVLTVLALVSAMLAWRRFRSIGEEQARLGYAAAVQERTAEGRPLQAPVEPVKPTKGARPWPFWPAVISAVTAGVLGALAAVYRAWGHGWMFTGDGTRGHRTWVVHQLEGWSSANVVVVLIGVPLVFILLGWIRQTIRDARIAKRHALVYAARTRRLR